MPPKLNKLSPPKKTPPKGASLLVDGAQQHGLSALPSTKVTPPSGSPDPFAPKKSVLGAISPSKDKEDGTDTSYNNSVPPKDDAELQDENHSLEKEKEKQQQEADALLEAELILAEEIRLEEQQQQQEVENAEDKKLLIDTALAISEEEKADLLGSSLAEEEMNKAEMERTSQKEDEFHEATMLSAQEAKIDRIIHKTNAYHMSAYHKPLTALSLDIPLHRAVFKDDIDTVKMYMTEDFADSGSGDPETHFLSIRDSRGRTALHVAAAGKSPLMVEYLLTYNRVCLEKMKYEEMQKIKEERKSCLLELKMSMKKSMATGGTGPRRNLADTFSKNDYRVAAIENWFEAEVARIHRKVELLTEAQWLRGLLQRDKQGLAPLHYAVHTGSVEVLKALLCQPPFFTGRGVFSAENKQRQQEAFDPQHSRVAKQRRAEKPYEWFKVGGVYNSATGEEVAVMHKMQTGDGIVSVNSSEKESDSRSNNMNKQKLTLHDVAQVSSFKAYIAPTPHEEEAENPGGRTKVDYDIVVPWLVRNVYKRSRDMGKKLGASAVDVLEEMSEMVSPSDKNRVLILPEIREFLRYLGIVVTTDVIKELCNVYPAALDLVEEKYQNYIDNEDEMLLSDSKSFRSNFPNADKHGRDRFSKSTGSKYDHDSDSKSTSVHRREAGSKGSKSSSSGAKDDDGGSAAVKKKSLFDPNSEEVTYGLSLDLFFDDIATGRGMKSIFSDTVQLAEEDAANSGRDERGAGDGADGGSRDVVKGMDRPPNTENDVFQMPAVISVANIQEYRKLLINCRDGAGNTALIVAAALGKLRHVENLVSSGADISVESMDGQTPLSVAKNASIIGILQRELVTQLKKKRKSMLMGGTGSISHFHQNSSSALYASMEFVDTMKSTPNATTMNTTNGGTTECAADDVLFQLQDLKTKRWAFSQSALTWAVESGSQNAIDSMLAQGCDTNEADISGRSPLHTCMHLASQACHSHALLSLRKMIESLLNSGGDVHAATISGKTPLHELFTANKSSEMSKVSSEENALLCRLRAVLVRTLLQWGADPFRTDRLGYNSLHYCAKENMSLCMIEILKAKAINVNCQDPRGRTVLHIACIHGADDVAKVIVNYDGDYVTGIQRIEDKDGKTAKHLMSPRMSALSLVTLWQACRAGDMRSVNSLLAITRKKDKSGNRVAYENVEEEQTARNPLDVTAGQEDGNKDLWLLGGVDCKTRLHKWTPLHSCVIGWAEFNAAKTKSKHAIRALKHGEKTTKSISGKQLSFRQTKKTFPASLTDTSFSTILSVLIQNFAYTDSLEFKCRTPLMLAAAFDLPTAVALLCTAGADVNMRDLDGNTALHYAYACGSNRAVSALEDRDADSNIENNEGKTSFEVVGLIGTIAPFFK